MYLDAKRIAMGIAGLAIGGMAWFMMQWKNETTRNQIEAIEGGVAWNEEAIAGEMTAFAKARSEASELLLQGDYKAASLKMYHAYPKLESYLNVHGYRELASGGTVKDWFEKEKAEMNKVLAKAYPGLIDAVSTGDLSWRVARDFFNHFPFVFINEYKRKYATDKAAIAERRLSQAKDWTIVYVGGSMGSSGPYEEAVRKALKSKWPSDSRLKLVFGGTMNSKEKKAAAYVASVYLEGEEIVYQFEDKHANRGSDRALERVVATLEIKSQQANAKRTSWHDLQPMKVHHEAPEVVTFRFENDRQMADFSSVIEKQRQVLLDKLNAEVVEKIPVFALK